MWRVCVCVCVVCFEEWEVEGNLSLLGRSAAAALMNGGNIGPWGTVRLTVIDVIKGIWLWVTCGFTVWQQRWIYVFVPLPGLAAFLAGKFVKVLLGWRPYLRWPQTPMNHLEMSHPRSWCDDSLTSVSLVLSRAFFMLLDLLCKLFLWVTALYMQDYTCACFALSANLQN